MKKTRICLSCSKKIIGRPSLHKNCKHSFCSSKCYGNWKRNEKIVVNGYIEVYQPKHPKRNYRNRVSEHRLVVEKSIGRYLKRDEQVHHINGDRSDNRLSNLQVLSCAEHMRLERLGGIKDRWGLGHDFCTNCGRTDREHNARGLCSTCYVNVRKKKLRLGQWNPK